VGAVPRLVPLRPEDGEWRLDTEAMAEPSPTAPRTIFVANPGMPTGNHLSDQEWEGIASICEPRGVPDQVRLGQLEERLLVHGRSIYRLST
jgi:aspartate/methionine/tyrosine aminotransferase